VTEPQSIRFGPVLAFVVLWLGGSELVVGAVLRPMLPGGWATVGAVMLFCAAAIVVLARGLTGSAYPAALTRLFLFRPFWYLMLFMPLLAVAATVGLVAGLPFGVSRTVGTWSVAAVASLLALVSIVGYLGTRKLVVRHFLAHLPNLPGAFDGVRIAQISDVHVGPHTSRRHLARIAQSARESQPDLVVYTGDQVDDFARDVEYFFAAFGEVKAPLGRFAIIGNHDVFAGWEAVCTNLTSGGIPVLLNEAVPIHHEGARLWLAGTGDPAGSSWGLGGSSNAAPDIDRTLRDIPPGEPTIVLAHNPALWPELAQRGVDLTLSGHTHYGQLAIPRWGWSIASTFLELAMGTHRRERSLLYISPGANYWGVPFRIGTPPEVTVLTLRRCQSGQAPSIEPVNGGDRRHRTSN